jgi:hypothetical protein
VYLGTLFGSDKVAIKCVPCKVKGKDVQHLMQEVSILKSCR